MSTSTDAGPHQAMTPAPAWSSSDEDDDKLPLEVFTVALGLCVWIACGSLSLAIAQGGGAHPTRRLLIGALLVTGTAGALWQRRRVCAWLRARPGLIVPIAAAQFGAAAVDGLLKGPYVALSITSIGLAVVVARPRTVWLCVGLLGLSYVSVISLGHSPAALARDDQLAGALGALLAYPFAALIGLGLVRLFARFFADIDSSLNALRQGGSVLTPALTRALQRGWGSPLALSPAPIPPVRLTPTEIKVVEGLAGGSAPKELAHRWGVSLATVRTHIAHAKRKTGARTLRELATMAVHLDWPNLGDR